MSLLHTPKGKAILGATLLTSLLIILIFAFIPADDATLVVTSQPDRPSTPSVLPRSSRHKPLFLVRLFQRVTPKSIFRVAVGVVIVGVLVAAVWCLFAYVLVPLVRYFGGLEVPNDIPPEPTPKPSDGSLDNIDDSDYEFGTITLKMRFWQFLGLLKEYGFSALVTLVTLASLIVFCWTMRPCKNSASCTSGKCAGAGKAMSDCWSSVGDQARRTFDSATSCFHKKASSGHSFQSVLQNWISTVDLYTCVNNEWTCTSDSNKKLDGNALKNATNISVMKKGHLVSFKVADGATYTDTVLAVYKQFLDGSSGLFVLVQLSDMATLIDWNQDLLKNNYWRMRTVDDSNRNAAEAWFTTGLEHINIPI